MNIETQHSALASVKNWCSPQTFRCIEQAKELPSRYIVTGGSPLPVVKVRSQRGETALHSESKPFEEASRQVSRWKERSELTGEELIVVVGYGNGAHCTELLKLPSPYKMIVVEPVPESLPAVLQKAAPDPALMKNSYLISNNDQTALVEEFRELMLAAKATSVRFFVHPGCKRTDPEYYNRTLELLKNAVSYRRSEIKTMYLHSNEWFDHAAANLYHVVNSVPVKALKNSFRLKPAAVVAAGPSLTESLPYLKENRSKYIVYCVGTAYKTLKEHDVDPDFVVAVDGSSMIWPQFETVDCSNDVLLGAAHLDPRIIDKFEGRYVSFSCGGVPGVDRWLREGGVDCGEIPSKGTVTYSAVAAAAEASCNPVYLFGLDLAWSEDGRSHTEGTMYDGKNTVPEKPVRVPGNTSETVRTSAQFKLYIEGMNELFNTLQKKDVNVVNVNTGGARFEGTEFILPEDLNVEFSETDVENTLEMLFSGKRFPSDDRIKTYIQETMSELEKLFQLTDRAIQLSNVLHESENVEQHTELRSVEQQIKQQKKAGLLMEAAAKSTALEVLHNTSPDQALERTVKLYESMHEAVKKCLIAVAELSERIGE